MEETPTGKTLKLIEKEYRQREKDRILRLIERWERTNFGSLDLRFDAMQQLKEEIRN